MPPDIPCHSSCTLSPLARLLLACLAWLLHASCRTQLCMPCSRIANTHTKTHMGTYWRFMRVTGVDMLPVYRQHGGGMASDEVAHAPQASMFNQAQPAVRSTAKGPRAVNSEPVGGQLLIALRAHPQLVTGRVPTGRGPGPAMCQRHQRSKQPCCACLYIYCTLYSRLCSKPACPLN